MATLVLTAVGTALGGPIGGALGAILGQQADAALFAPKARQGARLTDLKVQTSSYGDAIPKLFGTLRVAGTVIWATDLIERRQRRSQGKGRPKLVEYSYSVSLAVALSARAIRSVGRIWADGTMLRDSAGKLAEQVVVRVHDGSADQAVDPLIASALGPEQGCAFRGLAYVLLEELDLAAFGNRIPQLSFEVTADAAPMSVAAVVGELTGSVVEIAPGTALAGYAASGARVREAMAPLAELAQLGLRQGPAGWQIAAPEAMQAAATDAALARVHADAAVLPESEQRMALGAVAAAVSLRHYDLARDYQTSMQTAVVAGGGGRPTLLELPAAMAAGAAKTAVQRLALTTADTRRRVNVRAGLGALALPLGAILPIDLGGAGGRWRIAERVVADGGVRLTMVQHAPQVDAADIEGDGGLAQLPADLPGGTTTLAIFDVPGDGEAARSLPLRLVAAAGSDARWRGADLWWVTDPESEREAIGRIGSALALGELAAPVAAMQSVLVDRATTVELILANDAMVLANISHAQLLAGGNRAMLGGEAMQFERATPLGGARWRLDGLLRGRGGTEAAAGPHAAGTQFALIDDAALVALPDAMAARATLAGAAIERQERGSADLMMHAVTAGAQATLPLAPVHGRVRWIAGEGRRAEWTARSRVGARWRDGVEVPVGESRLRWRVRFYDAADEPVETELETPWIELAGGSFAPASLLTVVQVGDLGVSPPLAMPLD